MVNIHNCNANFWDFKILFFTDLDDTEDEPDPEPETEAEPDSLANMLNKGDEDDYYGYEDAY